MASYKTAKKTRLSPEKYAKRSAKDLRRLRSVVNRLLELGENGDLPQKEMLLLLQETSQIVPWLIVHYR